VRQMLDVPQIRISCARLPTERHRTIDYIATVTDDPDWR
jgi:hypothetical protein